MNGQRGTQTQEPQTGAAPHLTVAFQGNPGAYGEIAALNALKSAGVPHSGVTTRGYPTFHEVARAVEGARPTTAPCPSRTA